VQRELLRQTLRDHKKLIYYYLIIWNSDSSSYIIWCEKVNRSYFARFRIYFFYILLFNRWKTRI